MTYATQQDLTDRFGADELIRLTDRVNRPATTIDATAVAKALADADALINSYVAKKYELPLATVPPILVRHAADIARFYLHGDNAREDDPATLAFKRAEAWLKDVARGLVALDDGTGDEPAAQGGGEIRIDVPERVMSRDSLEGY